VRVCQEVAGRANDSPPQRSNARIRAACEPDGLELLDINDELDVSGGKPLISGPVSQAAVQAIDSGQAEVVAAAYFDRLFRSRSTQAEVIERVQDAGGQVLAVDDRILRRCLLLGASLRCAPRRST